MLLLGIVIVVTSVIGIAAVGVMFWWAAREDGRDQRRRDAEARSRGADG